MNPNTTYPNLIGTFDTYFVDGEKKNPKSELLELLHQPSNWNYDIVIIEGEIGNGSTHLLHGLFREIKILDRTVTYMTAERLFSDSLNFMSESQFDTEFFLIDSYSFVELGSPKRVEAFVALVYNLVERGIKVVVSSNIDTHQKLRTKFLNHLIVTSPSPNPITCRKKIMSHLYEELNEKEISLIEAKSIHELMINKSCEAPILSFRLIEAMLLMVMVQLQSGQINIETENSEIDFFLEKLKFKMLTA